MNWIELEYNDVGERAVVTVYIKNILYIREYPGGRSRVYFTNGEYIPVSQSRQEIKDIIAACYGAEDEED